MRILAHAIHGSQVHVQVRYGVWPLSFDRTYRGRQDRWTWERVNGFTFSYNASALVRARLTRFFNRLIAQEQAEEERQADRSEAWAAYLCDLQATLRPHFSEEQWMTMFQRLATPEQAAERIGRLRVIARE